MARKVKFPLELRDGYLARSNIEEVRAHFDLEKIIAQFHKRERISFSEFILQTVRYMNYIACLTGLLACGSIFFAFSFSLWHAFLDTANILLQIGKRIF